MARQVATEEAVFAAADALIAQGAEPSTTLVQQRTAGSYTTVMRHLDAWTKARRKGLVAAVALPPEIELRGREFVQGLYAHALQTATAAVAEPLAQAEAARAKAAGLLAGAEAEVVRLEGVERDQAARIDAMADRVRELEISGSAQRATIEEKATAIGQLEAQLAEARSGLAARDQELAGLQATARTVEALRQQLEVLQQTIQASWHAGAPGATRVLPKGPPDDTGER